MLAFKIAALFLAVVAVAVLDGKPQPETSAQVQRALALLKANPRASLNLNPASTSAPTSNSNNNAVSVRRPRIVVPNPFGLAKTTTSQQQQQQAKKAAAKNLNKKQDDFQAIQVFTDPGQGGLTATLYAEYCGDLRTCFEVDMDNVISSARVFGIWLFYDGYGYGINDQLPVTWIWGDDYYYDFTVLDNAVSSIRFVGREDNFFADSITLFSDSNFKAWEYLIYDDMPSLTGWDFLVDSAIVTGFSGWTLYEFEFYQGNHVCLVPESDGNPGLYPTASSVGLNFIRSARRGCFSANKRTPLEIRKNVLYSSKQFE